MPSFCFKTKKGAYTTVVAAPPLVTACLQKMPRIFVMEPIYERVARPIDDRPLYGKHDINPFCFSVDLLHVIDRDNEYAAFSDLLGLLINDQKVPAGQTLDLEYVVVPLPAGAPPYRGYVPQQAHLVVYQQFVLPERMQRSGMS